MGGLRKLGRGAAWFAAALLVATAGVLMTVGAVDGRVGAEPLERLAASLGASVGACPLERLEEEGMICLRAQGRSPAEWEARLAGARGVWLLEATRGDEDNRRTAIRVGDSTYGVLAVPGVLVIEPPAPRGKDNAIP